MSVETDIALGIARALIDAAVAHVGRDKARELLDASDPDVIAANVAADLAEVAKGLK